jgi:hypothetical protein
MRVLPAFLATLSFGLVTAAAAAAPLRTAGVASMPGAASPPSAVSQLASALELDATGAAPGLERLVASSGARGSASAGGAALAGSTPGAERNASITASLGVRGLARLAWNDLRDVATAPRDWDRHDWFVAGGVGAAVVASALWLDQPSRDAAQRNQDENRERVAKQVEKFGTDYALLTVAGLYGYGLVAHDREAEAAGIDAGLASVIGAGIVTPLLKETFGRARPEQNRGRYHFAPFGGDASFPSGHTTEAFAVASVVADHYDSPWVKAGAYGLAGLVGASRVYRDAHWVSDTIAGAAIGAFVGHEIVRLDARLRDSPAAEHTHLVPTTILGAPALALRVDF